VSSRSNQRFLRSDTVALFSDAPSTPRAVVDTSPQSSRDVENNALEVTKRLQVPGFNRDRDCIAFSSTRLPIHDILYDHYSDHDVEIPSKPPVLTLPSWIRHRIYSKILPVSEQKVILTSDASIEGVWPNQYFRAADDMIRLISGALGSCRQLREDLLIYFWGSFHFHMTISPFSRTHLSPFSQKLMYKYSDKVRWLSIELDLTRLGLHYEARAELLKSGSIIVKTTFERLMLRMSRRSTSMDELHLLCRRYKGNRPRPLNSKEERTF
jgi:hypothetical protein